MKICIYVKPESLQPLQDFLYWSTMDEYEAAAFCIKSAWRTTRMGAEEIEVIIGYDQYMMLLDND